MTRLRRQPSPWLHLSLLSLLVGVLLLLAICPISVKAFGAHDVMKPRTATTTTRRNAPSPLHAFSWKNVLRQPFEIAKVKKTSTAADSPALSSSSSTLASSSSRTSPNTDATSAELPDTSQHDNLSQDYTSTSNKDLQGNNDPSSLPQAPLPSSSSSATRLRRLKDLVWVRECLEDLTAAEFALNVEAHGGDDTEASAAAPASSAQEQRRRRKRAVDYDKLLSQLNRRLQDLGCDFASAVNDSNDDNSTVEPLTCVLPPNVGMGTTAYTEEQRQLLLERLVRTRQNLMEIIRGIKHDPTLDDDNGVDLPFSIALPDLRVEIPREVAEANVTAAILGGPKLYVRDDGTVDWDGALQDQAALRKFGGAVWARINGRDPEILDSTSGTPTAVAAAGGGGHGAPSSSVTARVIETPEIQSARAELQRLQTDYQTMQDDHTALLNSVIRQGQAVANVNLASLEPAERRKILQSADTLEKMRERVSYQTLLYELERIYTYLAGELGSPQSTGYISLQDRLNIAEFGLVESQVESFRQQLQLEESIDADVLAVVMEQVNDFKRRLGIDYFVTGVTFDREAIARWLGDLLDQTREGLAFYVKGVRLFWNDIVFCLNLVSRAVQGYTLKPREVRTIRRTFKDILTFIPFVIILIIPLTPVGHVLVFGAIQRFFPEFFPSCFTEQRQNLLQLYENAEYTEFTINESLKDKASRLVLAFFYFVASSSKTIYTKAMNSIRNSNSKRDGGKR